MKKQETPTADEIVDLVKQHLNGSREFGDDFELPATIPASIWEHKLQVAITTARDGNIEPLRTLLVQRHGADVAEFIRLPLKPKGKYVRHPTYRNAVAEAAFYEPRIAAILKSDYGDQELPIDARGVVVQIFNVTPEEITRFNDAARKRAEREAKKKCLPY